MDSLMRSSCPGGPRAVTKPKAQPGKGGPPGRDERMFYNGHFTSSHDLDIILKEIVKIRLF